MDQFGLNRSVEALDWSVIPAIAFTTHDTTNSMIAEEPAVRFCSVLAATIRVVQEFTNGSASHNGHRRIDALVDEFNKQTAFYIRGVPDSPIDLALIYKDGRKFGWGLSECINTFTDPNDESKSGQRFAIPLLIESRFEETCALVTSKANCDIAKNI